MKANLKILAGVALGLLGLATAPAAFAADTYPTRPVTMIVPYGAGGGTDTVARIVSAELGEALGQAIVVEARPGANGAIGSAAVARARPDGYTMLFTASSTYALNPSLMKDPLFDQLKDLVAVATIGRSPWMLTVPASSPFKTVADVVAYAKANPNKLEWGYWQSSVLVTTEIFAQLAGIQMRKVPYRGQVEALTDFLGGRLPLMVNDVTGARGPVAAGQMRILATTTAKRILAYPDVPTMRECGLDVVTDSVLMVFAPTGTPRPIIERMNAELSRIVNTSAKVRERLAQVGLDPAVMTPSEADAFVRSEIPRWADLIHRAGLEKE
jgi:tripartite-type tricarboxylate transporter receptor subunit TctC